MKLIERKWHVETNCNSRSGIITTLVHIVPDDNVNLQKDENFSPASSWSPCISEEVKAFIKKVRSLGFWVDILGHLKSENSASHINSSSIFILYNAK